MRTVTVSTTRRNYDEFWPRPSPRFDPRHYIWGKEHWQDFARWAYRGRRYRHTKSSSFSTWRARARTEN